MTAGTKHSFFKKKKKKKTLTWIFVRKIQFFQKWEGQ